jgi:hypothetical protein
MHSACFVNDSLLSRSRMRRFFALQGFFGVLCAQHADVL